MLGFVARSTCILLQYPLLFCKNVLTSWLPEPLGLRPGNWHLCRCHRDRFQGLRARWSPTMVQVLHHVEHLLSLSQGTRCCHHHHQQPGPGSQPWSLLAHGPTVPHCPRRLCVSPHGVLPTAAELTATWSVPSAHEHAPLCHQRSLTKHKFNKLLRLSRWKQQSNKPSTRLSWEPGSVQV